MTNSISTSKRQQHSVIPAKAGIQGRWGCVVFLRRFWKGTKTLDSRFRGNDEVKKYAGMTKCKAQSIM
jgi:hypothetical protein